MLSLKVIGDPEKVSKKLNTNRPISEGMTLTCGSEFAMRKMAAESPNLFELVGDEKSKSPKPKSNKMIDKGSKFKSKGSKKKDQELSR